MTRRRTALAAMLSCALAGGAALALSAAERDAAPGTQTRPAGKASVRAQATLAGEGVTGTVEFVEMTYDSGSEVEITLSAKGLKPGMHGVHLARGRQMYAGFRGCRRPFRSRTGEQPDPDANHPYHMGDIPQLARRRGRHGDDEGRDDAGHAVGWTGVALRRRRIRGHRPRQPGSGDTGEPKSGVSGGRASRAA